MISKKVLLQIRRTCGTAEVSNMMAEISIRDLPIKN